MDEAFAGELLKGMSQRVPDKLIQFGRALDSACILADGWPYFLEKSHKWASEYTRWAELDSPQPDDPTWPNFMNALDSVAT